MIFSSCSKPLEVSYDSCRPVHSCIARRMWSFRMDTPLISPHLISALHLKTADVSAKTEPNSVFHKTMFHPDSLYHSLLKNLPWASVVLFPHCLSKTHQVTQRANLILFGFTFLFVCFLCLGFFLRHIEES